MILWYFPTKPQAVAVGQPIYQSALILPNWSDNVSFEMITLKKAMLPGTWGLHPQSGSLHNSLRCSTSPVNNRKMTHDSLIHTLCDPCLYKSEERLANTDLLLHYISTEVQNKRRTRLHPRQYHVSWKHQIKVDQCWITTLSQTQLYSVPHREIWSLAPAIQGD